MSLSQSTLKRDLSNLFHLKKTIIKAKLQQALTKIYISFNLQTSLNWLAFISIFSYFINKKKRPQAYLLAFRCQIRSHSSENVAPTIWKVFTKDWNIKLKLGVVICDNALSNNTYIYSLYQSLNTLMLQEDIKVRRM